MLLVLVALQFLSFTHGSQKHMKSYSQCEAMSRKEEPSLALVFQCLTAHYNLSATLSDVMIKMNQVQQHLDLNSNDQEYIQSPFKNLDDILDIPSDLAGKDCQYKRQIVQAIRRKLVWYNVMENKESSLFELNDDTIKIEPSEAAPENAVSQIKVRTDYKRVLREIRCLLAKSIRNTEPTVSATKNN
ncbi:uncharacterized protein LOC26535347 [Drosophila yakuba]|uniref:Uncharacterized protein n=1 Tax=Drosophila yakuba TaxID=7245 RepID=A0A0R1E234_DROYA|nr:uncharacterized protein LOC26535347 [Drosophila yakuba]KRK01604.1 uncharacterized protein Dyak_GE28166 [Drosophila yakuba]